MANALSDRHGHDAHDANDDKTRSAAGHSPGKATLTQQLAGAGGDAPGKATLTQQLTGAHDGADHAEHDESAQSPTVVSLEDASDLGSFGGPGGGLSSEDGDDGEGRTLGGAAKEASTSNTKAPSWKKNGRFQWWIKWKTDGKKGWLVQKITNTYSGTRADGSAITNASVGAQPSYYEAWEVTSTGHVKPAVGSTNDMWERVDLGKGSKGSWSMKGDVHWTNKDPALSGLTPGGAPNAGILVSGFTAPAGIGGTLLARHANGHWDSTKKTPTHTGTAK